MFLSFNFGVMSNDSIALHIIRALVSRHKYIPSLTSGCRALDVVRKQVNSTSTDSAYPHVILMDGEVFYHVVRSYRLSYECGAVEKAMEHPYDKGLSPTLKPNLL